jgi:hypothetical protein
MHGIDEGITLDIEEDTGHEQNRSLSQLQPGVAGLAADLEIIVSPAIC